MFKWLVSTNRHEIDYMEGTSREIRYYWARFDELTAVDSVLGYKVYKNEINDYTFRAIVPRRSRQEILERAHAPDDGGHFGVHQTISKLKQRFYWLRLSYDVRDWCARCCTCNRHKTQQQNRALMQPIVTGEPFELVAMDIIRPLPKTD